MNDAVKEFLFFGAAVSIFSYELGLLIKKKLKLAVFNPLLISILLVMGILSLFHIEYDIYLSSARYLSYLLTPATVCLAIPLYKQLHILRKHAKAILLGTLAGVLTTMVSVLLLALLFGLTHEQYVTFLPKSITTAIAMGIAVEQKGVVTITIACVILTGILGNVIGESACRLFKITEPVAKGMALGASSHAIGTARAMEMGEIEGAMSSLAIATSGLCTVLLASVFADLL